MSKRIIAIVGATNAPGRSLVRAIVNDSAGPFAARAMALDLNTDPAREMAQLGAEVVVGHAAAGRGLEAAFNGAHGAFYFRTAADHTGPQRELAEARALALAAKDAQLRHVIWATADEVRSDIANVFGSLGVPITLLRAHRSPIGPDKAQIADEIGRCAYEILRSGQHIGEAVSINPPNPGSSSDQVGQPPSDLGQRKRGSRSLGAWLVVPAFAAFALFGFEFLRCSRGEEEPPPTVETAEPAAPAEPAEPTVAPIDARPATRTVVDASAKEEPPTSEPTVTAKWEAERAAVMKKRKGPGARSVQAKYRAPVHVRHRKHGRGEHERTTVAASASGSASTAEEAPAAPAPPESAVAPTPPAPPKKESAAHPAPAPAAPPAPPVASGSRARESPVTPVPASPPAASSSRGKEAPGAPTPAPGFVDPRKVTAAVRAHADEVRACFDRAVMERSDLHGRLTVHAAIDPTGHVLSLSPISTIDGGGRLEACVASAFKTWTFPTPAGGVKGNITYSFTFE